ncbi:MAG: aldehyde oxidase [Spirochaetaceae bacterium]|nr:MAG: aldehyde oxidase [Spirochaetaceae bacterium]
MSHPVEQHPVTKTVERVDAREKARGETRYLADIPFPGRLFARVVRARIVRGEVVARNTPSLPEGYILVTADDIPAGGKNCVRMIEDDWPVFSEGTVRYYGEPLALLVGPDRATLAHLTEQCERAVEFRQQEAALTIEDALLCRGGAIHGTDNVYCDYQVVKGDPDGAMAGAARTIEGEYRTGFQEHVYIEPQSLVGTREEGRVTIYISTQCPFYVRKAVATALGLPQEEVVIIQTPTGGGFGGKEHYPDVLATTVAVALTRIDGPIELILDRMEDLEVTSKRHPSRVRYKAGLDEAGRISAFDVDIAFDGGAYESSSRVVLQRGMFSSNSVYEFPHVRVRGRAVATNSAPSDAFRGFGAPQGLFAAEMFLSRLAREIGVDDLDLRKDYLLQQGSTTMTGGRIHEEVKLPEMLEHVLRVSDYRRKREAYAAAARDNGANGTDGAASAKPLGGIGLALFKHGSAFTGSGEQEIIKARVRIRKRADGRPELLVSNVEIGQGVLTTFCKIVAQVLEIPYTDVVYDDHNTSHVPDSGPTCASRSVAVVGYLLQEAAKKLKGRLHEPGEFEVEQVYKHPEHLRWDAGTLSGDAYPSYSWGVNCIEVAVDPLTWEVDVRGVWTAYELGRAIDEEIVRGQIIGGAIQALGYAGLEKMENPEGRFLQRTMADYCIPTSLDYPGVDYALFDNPYPWGPFGAKGGGEVVFDGIGPAYAAAVQQAIGREVTRLPVTPEYISELVHEK